MQPYHILPKTDNSIAGEWLGIGVDHQSNLRYQDAERAYENALRLDPNSSAVVNNVGVMCAQQNRLLEAVKHLERSVLFDEKSNTAWYNLALAYLEAERVDDSLSSIKKSLELVQNADAYCAYGMILTSAGRAEQAVEAYQKCLEKNSAHNLGNYNHNFVRTLTESTPKDNLEARNLWYKNLKPEVVKKPHVNNKNPDRPLKIGYVGGDFKMHSAAFIFSKVIFEHSEEFKTICYQTLPFSTTDAMTQKFIQKSDFKDVQSLNDDQFEDQIRKDEIDILVDLSGFTSGNRLQVFTRKPAPVQVTAWGFAHGTGIPEIDYFFACPLGVPEEERQYFTEKIWDLPATITYLPPEYNQSGVSPAPFRKNDYFTFGVYGRFEKFSQKSLETYAKILKQVPKSKIVFRDRSFQKASSIKHVRQFFNGTSDRVLFSSWGQHHPEHMLSYQDVDLVLDTFPHSGGVTSLEELYMGVPILTIYNGNVGGRSTSIALNSMGRKEWISYSPEEFVEKAVVLSDSVWKLHEARKTIREEFINAPICKGYTQEVEKAYREMWRKWCQ